MIHSGCFTEGRQEELWHELVVAGHRADMLAITKVASARLVENLDSGRLIGADGKLWALHLTPLAKTHLKLGSLEAAKRVCGEEFLHEATPESSAAALANAMLEVLEERHPPEQPGHKVFPICWLTRVD